MRRLVLALAVVAALGAAAWHWQSQLIGMGARWWLERVATREASSGELTGRRDVVARMNRALLMPPPPDALVPELFDVVTDLSSRVATGEVSFEWAAWIYTTYQQDMLRDRPNGTPARTADQVQTELARLRDFYAIQRRPDARGVTVGDMLGTGDDVITLDEIQQADKTGKKIDLRTRGAHPGQ
jgi:hypothetical protein